MNDVGSLVVFESLEARELLSATPTGMTPGQIRRAYGFDLIKFRHKGRLIAGDGRGQTIAIVTAYHAPNLANDFKTFSTTFGLPTTDWKGSFSLTQLTYRDQFGRVPPVDAGWAGEASLDVEWSHAIAPKAHILLVEAASASTQNLLTAVDYARSQKGVVAVSMSWGAHETPFQQFYDDYLTTPAGHLGGGGRAGGVTFISASGDAGAPATWPGTSSHVVAIGGTTLTTDQNGKWAGEVAWAGSGGGPSRFQGTYAPDVSYDADPRSGFAVYDSTQGVGWQTFGGTSAGAPQWAGLIAIADQGRAYNGLASLDGPDQTIDALYSMPKKAFHDITQGSNGYPALPGYDLVTGRGSPMAQRVVKYLVAYGNRGPSPARANVATEAAPVHPAEVLATSFSRSEIRDLLGAAA
jgi:subtilase family serine protease